MIAIMFGISACSNDSSETISTKSESTEESTTKSEEETESTTKEEESVKEKSTKEETTKETETETKTTTEESKSKTETITKESEGQTEKESESQNRNSETKSNKVSESSEQSTPKQQEETTAVETTPAPHTHNYSSSITTNPTCTSNGVQTYTCSCGDSYTEAIPTTDHNWVTEYEEVFHESQGEMRQVEIGTSDKMYQCGYCGEMFSTSEEHTVHCKSYLGTDNAHAMSRWLIHSGQPIYENQWVVTQEEYTEQVPYQICATCGATK